MTSSSEMSGPDCKFLILASQKSASLAEVMALILVVSDEEMIFRSSQIYCWHPDSWPIRSRSRFGVEKLVVADATKSIRKRRIGRSKREVSWRRCGVPWVLCACRKGLLQGFAACSKHRTWLGALQRRCCSWRYGACISVQRLLERKRRRWSRRPLRVCIGLSYA